MQMSHSNPTSPLPGLTLLLLFASFPYLWGGQGVGGDIPPRHCNTHVWVDVL